MREMTGAREGGISEPIRCPACGHEVGQPEVVTTVDPVTGQAEPTEGVQYRCARCGFVFPAEEARQE